MVFHQAAMSADPQNYLAANELGVLLAKYDQYEEAKRFLLRSLQARPSSQAWHNLATVHERLGETDLAQRAQHELNVLTAKSTTANPSTSGPAIEWLPPERFAQTAGHDGQPTPASPPATEPPGPSRREARKPSSLLKPWSAF
jgi:Tfp pilus assembly protein PilF